MSDKLPELPDVHYGTADSPPVDWRDADQDIGEDDDEELDEMPPGFVEILGLDPTKMDWSDVG